MGVHFGGVHIGFMESLKLLVICIYIYIYLQSDKITLYMQCNQATVFRLILCRRTQMSTEGCVIESSVKPGSI